MVENVFLLVVTVPEPVFKVVPSALKNVTIINFLSNFRTPVDYALRNLKIKRVITAVLTEHWLAYSG